MFARKHAHGSFFGDSQKTHFVSPATHLWRRDHAFWQFQHDPWYPPPRYPSCTSEESQNGWGFCVLREKREGDRTPLVKVEHRNRPRPIGFSFQAGRAARRTSHCRTACTYAEANWCFSQTSVFFFWGGEAYLGHFADSWVTKKTGVGLSRPGPNHGHKILVHKNATSLESVS